jgi:predicted transcriptional regulator
MDTNRELERVYRKVDKAFRQFLTERSEMRRVEQIMNREVITIDDNASMLTAAKMMGEKKIGSLVVTRKENAWGLVTTKDLINILAEGKDLADIRIKDAMFTPLISISPKATIAEAAKRMILRGGELVVFEGRNLVGAIRTSDIIKSLPECPETLLKIDDFMSEEIVSLDESASAIEAIKLMGDKNVGSVIVHRSGKPHSIFTDGDLILHYFTKERDLSDPIQNMGSSPLKSVPIGTTIHKIAYIMSKEKVKRLPVIKDDKLIGIITARDLIRAYAECD